MSFIKTTILSGMLILTSMLSGCSEASSEQLSPQDHIESIVNNVSEYYGVTPPAIEYDQVLDDTGDTLGHMQCRLDGSDCVLRFRYCVLEMAPYWRANLAAHEAAHYVNGIVNSTYDHGREWKSILRDTGWRVYETYPDKNTDPC